MFYKYYIYFKVLVKNEALAKNILVPIFLKTKSKGIERKIVRGCEFELTQKKEKFIVYSYVLRIYFSGDFFFLNFYLTVDLLILMNLMDV